MLAAAEPPEPFKLFSLKSEIEETVDTLLALFPLLVTGALLGLFGLNYVKNAMEWEAPRFKPGEALSGGFESIAEFADSFGK